MRTNKRYTVARRRAREGKTNYKTRLNMLKSRTPRLVIRKSLKQMTVQVIRYEPAGDKVLLTVRSSDVIKLGWKHSTGNTPSAYLTGLLAGKKLASHSVKNLILDIGQNRPVKGSRIFATLKGVVDAGIVVPHGDEIMPSEDRLAGKHIDAHRKTGVSADFEIIKKKIQNG